MKIEGVKFAGEKHLISASNPPKYYNYCGPGTQYDKRQASSNPKIKNPINRLDSACKTHDRIYNTIQNSYDDFSKDELKKMVRDADQKLIADIEPLEKNLDKMLVKGPMLAKMKAEDIGFLNKLKFVPPRKQNVIPRKTQPEKEKIELKQEDAKGNEAEENKNNLE